MDAVGRNAMLAAQPPHSTSAIGAGLLVLGDKWNLLILQQAFQNHVRRFADWRATLVMSESVLSARLKELVDAGLLEPAPYRTSGRSRIEYLLTDKALELWSFLVAIWAWERSWIVIPNWPTHLVHQVCGGNAEPELGCANCLVAPVTARDTTVVGPAVTFREVTVARHHRRTVREREHSHPDSYLRTTLEILGDRWSTLLLAATFLKVCRFVDFQSALGIAPGILSDRLRRFIELEVLTQARGDSDRDEYRLTAKGLGFFPVFAFLNDWAQRWYSPPCDADLRITHDRCATAIRPYLRCGNCHAELARHDVQFVRADQAAF